MGNEGGRASYNHQKRKSDVDEFDRTMRSTLDAAPLSVH